MATAYSSWVGTDDWRVKMDYSVSNSSNTTATVTITASVHSQYGSTRSTPCRAVFTCGSQSYTVDVNKSMSSWTTAQITSKSFSVTRTTSTQKLTVSAKLSWPNSTVKGYSSGTKATATASVSAKPSYTITYNANGGSGAPGKQTKWYGTTLKLSTTKPTRTGYTFKNWSTDFGDGSVYFNPGGNYTRNSAATLYANWTANTYTVSYNANGGTGAPSSQTKTYGVTLTLSSTKPTRTNYNFLGWATSATGAVEYQPGASYAKNGAVTLYAIWEIAYIPPTITNVSVDRCYSSGEIADDGAYLKVSFAYQLDAVYSGGMDYIQLGYKLSSAASYTNLSTYTPSAMSGSFSQIIGSGLVETEYAYDIQIVVKDQKGSSTIVRSVAPLSYIIDFSPEGGVAIGKPAPSDKSFEIDIPTTFDAGLAINVGGTQVASTTDTGRMQFLNHTQLANGMWLQGGLSSGSFTNMLRMNEDNQVELNWTSGGLLGRVRKQIWSGSASNGSTITVSELPYYNMIALGVSDADTAIVCIRDLDRVTVLRGVNVQPYVSQDGRNAFILSAADLDTNGTSLTLTRVFQHALYFSGTSVATGSVTKAITISRIYGIL